MLKATMNSFRRWAAYLLLALTSSLHTQASLAASTNTVLSVSLIASPEPDWPQWRGPYRDGISRETGLMRNWPEEGPRLLWKAGGLGHGYSAPIIVRDRIYITGDSDGVLKVHSLDLSGNPVWQTTNGAAWKNPFPGARASCTYSGGRLYHLNAHGRLACLNAKSGKEVWSVNILDEFDGRNVTWALSECLLAYDGKVFVTAGGSKALVAALNKETGEKVWTTPGLPVSGPQKKRDALGEAFDQASYGSPILLEVQGRPVLVNSSQAHVFAVDASSGDLLWTHHLPTRYWVIAATPVLVENAIFVTAPDTDATRLLQLKVAGPSLHIETLWKTDFDNGHGGVVPVGNELFGAWYRRKGWAGVDLRTGVTQQRISDLGSGSVLMADGHLYCLSQEGEMALVQPDKNHYSIQGRFRLVPERKTDVWAHPVILNGKLYLRYHDWLFCYDVRQ